jgi:hypothetical protein
MNEQLERIKRNQEIQKLQVQADIELRKIEANTTARESASKAIGKSAVAWIVLLVIVGVVSAAYLPTEALAPVIGLVATASMALIQMLAGITGTKDKEEKPEFQVIKELIARMDKDEPPMSVDVVEGRVTVTKGQDKVTTSSKE